MAISRTFKRGLIKPIQFYRDLMTLNLNWGFPLYGLCILIVQTFFERRNDADEALAGWIWKATWNTFLLWRFYKTCSSISSVQFAKFEDYVVTNYNFYPSRWLRYITQIASFYVPVNGVLFYLDEYKGVKNELYRSLFILVVLFWCYHAFLVLISLSNEIYLNYIQESSFNPVVIKICNLLTKRHTAEDKLKIAPFIPIVMSSLIGCCFIIIGEKPANGRY